MKDHSSKQHPINVIPSNLIKVADTQLAAVLSTKDTLREAAHLIEEPNGRIDLELAIRLNQEFIRTQ